MKLYQSLFLLTLGVAVTGCAVTSGLQTYDLPQEGVFQTELGSQVNLVKITPESLPALQTAQVNIRQDYAHLFNSRHQQYRLSHGDILSISLWAHTDLSAASSGYQIDAQGYIQLPLVGRYKASGKTLQQITKELDKLLKRYLVRPDVIVRVLSYASQRYSVQGNVAKSGQFYLNDQPTSVYTALGLAGGVNNQLGDNTSITLLRQGQSYRLNNIELENAGLSLHQLLIQPNDTLYVNARENQKIYVMGEAGKNQSLALRDQGMSLGDVLGESQGLNPLSASRSKIYVVRSHPSHATTQMYHLDLTSIADFGLANQFKMQANDIVYVDVSGLVRWQRVVNQILPFSNALYNIDRLGQ